MAVFGYTTLVLALVASLFSAGAYIIGGRRDNRYLLTQARNALYVAGGLVTVSVIVLLAAIFSHNFGLEYVFRYTSRDTSFFYLLSALWAGNDGSLLFWVWLTAIVTVAVVLRRREKNGELVPYAAAIILIVQAFFLILLVSVANPFRGLGYTPANGQGLNPLLENPGMILHPPALLAGYVSLTVPFAFALAALIKRRLNGDWLAAARRWTILAWLFLGAGNIIGAWWAYVELGWGGYWAWDPVENAGLMPWLMVTAFLHSVIIQRNRSIFKYWTMLLIILAFHLVIFGTFITRSGVLSSVHTYGLSSMGPFFLTFLIVSLVGSLWLVFSRRNELKSGEDINRLVSRESAFLFANILLVGATLIILIGTVFPGISEAIRGSRIGVGEDFFNRVGGPLFLAIILLIGLCTLIGWRLTSLRAVAGRILWPLGISVIATAVLFIFGIRHAYAIIAMLICFFVAFSVLYQWLRETLQQRRNNGNGFFGACWDLLRKNRPRYGGYIVHIGIVLMAIGVIGSLISPPETEVSLQPDDSVTVENYTLVYRGLASVQTTDKIIYTATIEVKDGDRLIDTLTPQKYYHRSYEWATEVAIRSTPVEDLYIILAGWGENGEPGIFTVLVNRLVLWLWIGGGVLIVGGLIAFWPERRRPSIIVRDTTRHRDASNLDDEIEQRIRDLRKGRGPFCTQCGAPSRPGDTFCAQCGARLVNKESN